MFRKLFKPKENDTDALKQSKMIARAKQEKALKYLDAMAYKLGVGQRVRIK